MLFTEWTERSFSVTCCSCEHLCPLYFDYDEMVISIPKYECTVPKYISKPLDATKHGSTLVCRQNAMKSREGLTCWEREEKLVLVRLTVHSVLLRHALSFVCVSMEQSNWRRFLFIMMVCWFIWLSKMNCAHSGSYLSCNEERGWVKIFLQTRTPSCWLSKSPWLSVNVN